MQGMDWYKKEPVFGRNPQCEFSADATGGENVHSCNAPWSYKMPKEHFACNSGYACSSKTGMNQKQPQV